MTVANAMAPMYLPDVENNPQPSAYADLIQSSKTNGPEYWQIWHLLAFRSKMTIHLGRFTHAVMYEPGPIESSLRELIATYTSSLNRVVVHGERLAVGGAIGDAFLRGRARLCGEKEAGSKTQGGEEQCDLRER